MKKSITVFLLLLPFLGISQSLEDWQLGIKKVTFGLVGSHRLKKFLSSNFSASAGIVYNYDLTDADNGPFFRADPEIEPEWEAKPTHHVGLGLELGLHYHFN